MDCSHGSTTSRLVGASPSKKPKTSKKKPMKVVYISNPIKFKTSASGFRALVQELTGQDSELPLNPSKLLDSGGDDSNEYDDGDPTVVDEDPKEEHAAAVDPFPEQFDLREVSGGDHNEVCGVYESFDDVFVPQMMENFCGIMPSSSFFNESAHVDLVSTTLDAM